MAIMIDTHAAVRDLEAAGIKPEHAEAIVKTVSQADADLVTKADLKAELVALRTEFAAELAALRTEFAAELAALRTEFAAELAALRSEFAAELAALRSDSSTELGTLRTEQTAAEGRLRTELAQLEHRRTLWTVTIVAIANGILFAALRYLPPAA